MQNVFKLKTYIIISLIIHIMCIGIGISNIDLSTVLSFIGAIGGSIFFLLFLIKLNLKKINLKL